MKIKVCGITRLEQLQQLQELAIDYAGMIFYKGSKRFAGDSFDKQKPEIRNLKIKKVGVFVNEKFETIKKAIDDYDLHAVQLHGDETDEFCLEFMDKVKVIKVFRLAGNETIDELTKPFQNACDYFMFDTSPAKPSLYGGTGLQFNWSILEKAKIDKPFFLSGGIGLEDLEKINSFEHPCLFAVDVNSRFEISPGVKDMEKVKRFISVLNF
ncbi:MAG: phosphoribosylanthranilate isomerase [Chitinophagaceae bacterium]